ncbi:MAG TPA: IclR family transcriptional regulator [Stellaceae bacterium]|nr:IclR family transcriptional regulator [Stellaceae bacterium]
MAGTQLLDRAIALLRLVADAGANGLAVRDLSAATGLSVSTCHRVAAALAGHGLLARDESARRYRLGLEFFVLGARAAERTGLGQLCRPVLTRLAAETDDTVLLMMRHNFESVCIDRRDGRIIIQTLTGAIGGSVPLGVGPGSQAILAFLAADEVDAIIAHNTPRYATVQGQNPALIRTAIEDVRARGYALDYGGIIQGVAGIAVPLRAPGLGVVASLGLGMLTSQLDDERVHSLVDRLKREAVRIEAEINPLSLLPVNAAGKQAG